MLKQTCHLKGALTLTVLGAAVTLSQGQSTELSGDLELRKKLAESGVRPFVTLTSEFWDNVAGGAKRDYWWNHLLDFGVELDTAKLGGWQGGSVLAQFHWVKNRRNDVSFGDYTGAINPVSGVMANDHFRVYNLYYRQSWREEAVVIKAGQLAADDDFMLSDYAGLFANSTLGAMPSQVDAPAFPVFPVASPGVFCAVHPTEKLVLQAGLYYGEPGPDTDSNYGFDWAKQPQPSIAVFYEAGFHYSIADHPATVRLGGTIHSGDRPDYRAIYGGASDAVRHGATSFYVVHDVVLVSRDKGEPLLAMFARGGIKPQMEESFVAAYGDMGLNWFGPIPGRPNDIAGAAVACTVYGQEYRKCEYPYSAASEKTVALTYKAQLTPWFSLQSDVQFLFDPAMMPSRSRETATVIGVRAQINF